MPEVRPRVTSRAQPSAGRRALSSCEPGGVRQRSDSSDYVSASAITRFGVGPCCPRASVRLHRLDRRAHDSGDICSAMSVRAAPRGGPGNRPSAAAGVDRFHGQFGKQLVGVSPLTSVSFRRPHLPLVGSLPDQIDTMSEVPDGQTHLLGLLRSVGDVHLGLAQHRTRQSFAGFG